MPLYIWHLDLVPPKKHTAFAMADNEQDARKFALEHFPGNGEMEQFIQNNSPQVFNNGTSFVWEVVSELNHTKIRN